jgi:multiple sugar transport system permease protein
VSVAAASTGLALERRHRRRRVLIEAGSVMLAVILLIWSLIPVYNMFLIALDPEEGEVEFTGNIWPPEPSLDAFGVVLTQADRYLEHFWQQFGNSLFIGLMTMLLTVLIGSLAGFAASRMRLGKGSLITNTALVTYVLPAAFLTIPFYLVVHSYGLSNDPWGGASDVRHPVCHPDPAALRELDPA